MCNWEEFSLEKFYPLKILEKSFGLVWSGLSFAGQFRLTHTEKSIYSP